jgi:pilus assembly protein CpaF
MTGIAFPIKTLREQIASAIDLVIQVERHEDGKRRVVSLAEINGMEGDIITMSDIFKFDRRGRDEEGNVLGSLQPTGIIPGFHRDLAAKGIDVPLNCFDREGG